MSHRVLFVPVFLFLGATARGEDWPDFRGPTGQGTSLEKELPTKWSATDNIAWSSPIPEEGWSTPIAWGERVFLTTATEGGESCRVIAAVGLINWSVGFPAKKIGVPILSLAGIKSSAFFDASRTILIP